MRGSSRNTTLSKLDALLQVQCGYAACNVDACIAFEAGRAPLFIDSRGVHCAVGCLMLSMHKHACTRVETSTRTRLHRTHTAHAQIRTRTRRQTRVINSSSYGDAGTGEAALAKAVNEKWRTSYVRQFDMNTDLGHAVQEWAKTASFTANELAVLQVQCECLACDVDVECAMWICSRTMVSRVAKC